MSTTKERAEKALAAMKDMGFPRSKTKPILKKLLHACELNWEHIEAESYRLLIETILDSDEPEAEVPKAKNSNDDNHNVSSKKREAPVSEEPELYRKRLRRRQEEQRPSASLQSQGMASMRTPKVEMDDSSQRRFSPERNLAPQSNPRESNEPSTRTDVVSGKNSPGQRNIDAAELHLDRQRKEVAVVTHRTSSINGQSKENAVAAYQKSPSSERMKKSVCFKEPKIEPDLDSVPGVNVPMGKDEPNTRDTPSFEIPIAIIRPPPPVATREEEPRSGHLERHCERNSPTADAATLGVNVSLESQNINEENRECYLPYLRTKSGANDEVANVVESSTNTVKITSSSIGEAKVSLLYNVVDCPDFQMPNLESILKRVEDRCLRSYKILDPNFSLMSIMKEVCKTVLELGIESVKDKREDPIRIIPSLDALKASGIKSLSGGTFACLSGNGSWLPQDPNVVVMRRPGCDGQPSQKGRNPNEVDNPVRKKGPEVSETSYCLALVCQHEPALGAVRPVHDVNDISKGEERVRVSIVNEFNSEQYPPHFSYIPHNIVYQNAYLNFSLARIGDEDYCSDCFGDCLSASIPCTCARETGGEYAYTLDGLLKKKFLDGCISMNQDPQKHHQFYCKDCPLERSKNDKNPDACKGHLVRKFIKECWSKCGCNKQCGNRVVQRGITCNLQVFFTPEGKGWGLRTLDDLPRGAFVCEYVGEVLTNMELYDRTVQTTGNAKHTYPVLLDADWGSEGVLKDEEALCLDATFYGNVARFINHRCIDANLVEVPVEVETPDRHYYHLAFFTTREVEAFEELTWDYGIDFDDHDHPIKAFHCLCGSKVCRDKKRPSRRKSGAIVLR